MGRTRTRPLVRAALMLAVAVALAALVAPERAFASIDSTTAVQLASAALGDSGTYEPDLVRGLEKKVERVRTHDRTYWLVTFLSDGDVREKVVVSAGDGRVIRDRAVLEDVGAWESFVTREGVVTSWLWAAVALLTAAVAGFGAFRWLRRPRLGWIGWAGNTLLGLTLASYAIGALMSLDISDWRGAATLGVATAFVAGGSGVGLVRRGKWAIVELGSDAPAATAGISEAASSPPPATPVPAGGKGGRAGGGEGEVSLRVLAPEQLPSFSDVGGMEDVKAQLRETVGLLVAHADLAKRYRIDWNGVLLYGPPGVGKTFIAKACAGEFGLSFIDVRVSDLLSRFVGESPKRISEVFRKAAGHRPCVLFFDEFDSVAQRREDASWDTESTRVVNQLLREPEAAREIPDLVVMAATNHKGTLDEAVIRPGRFDRHIAIGLPDEAARRRVFEAQLSQRPVEGDIDLADLVRRTDGLSAADIASVVNGAALEALRRSIAAGSTQAGAEEPITAELLVDALEALRAKVRPAVTFAAWEDLVLDPATLDKLKDLQRQIEKHDELAAHGIEPPRGVLLYGPPGTGKTTIARVLASQADASFFAVDASELVSMWVGETEKRIARLFEEARRHRPSIIFIDEIDSLVAARTGGAWSDDVTSQFLREIDGVSSTPGVFVIGATNCPNALDPALVRGGRLSRQLRIPLPDAPARAQLFRVHLKGMGVADDVDYAALAKKCEGLSGADIREVCQAAGLSAYERSSAEVTMADLTDALAGYRADRRTFDVPDWIGDWDTGSKGPLGFSTQESGSGGDGKPV